VQRDSHARFSAWRVANEVFWLLFDREALVPMPRASRTSGGWLGLALLVGAGVLAEHQLVTSVWPAVMSGLVPRP
jgi:hypothetical protein